MDMGKTTLHMIGLDTRGAIVLREKVSRGRIASRLANLPSCLIGIEAGLAIHYVARELAALGHAFLAAGFGWLNKPEPHWLFAVRAWPKR
jgi:hypothetical protein